MDGFKNLEINNFRGIKHLSIDEFSRVNVFLGQNNSGKSSVLEAIHMLTGMANPDTPQNLNRIRSRNFYTVFKDIFYLFHNMDIKTPPEIYSQQVDGDERWLRLNMAYVFDEQSLSTQASGLNGALPMSETKTSKPFFLANTAAPTPLSAAPNMTILSMIILSLGLRWPKQPS